MNKEEDTIRFTDLDMHLRAVMKENDVSTIDAIKCFIVSHRLLMRYLDDSINNLEVQYNNFLESLDKNESRIVNYAIQISLETCKRMKNNDE